MKLYNTLSRKLEEAAPLDGTTYRVYSCGPTVYDHAHIGNLSAYIFADTLRRVLAASSEKPVSHAMNYTDVDDKTIRRSREKYPELEPREALRRLTDEYIELFLSDMQRIGNDVDALTFLRATESIGEMQQLITELYSRGFAYLADDGVYFSIAAYRESGKKYGQLLEITAENTSDARIQNDEYDKESVHDFALWKKQKGDEPAWKFELGGTDMAGRPGWHIECSAMSRQGLGQPFDIHTGGIDLIFPHHENEIAQSTACTDNPVMANVFAHNAHILVDGRKMAKSAQNFYTLQDIIDRGHDPLAFRVLVLQSHYRSQTNFTWELLVAAQNRLQAVRAFAVLRFQAREDAGITQFSSDIRQTLLETLQDDLNTPQFFAALSGVLDEFGADTIDQKFQEEFTALIKFLDQVLSLDLMKISDITTEQKSLIAEREQARAAKEWAKSDQFRDQLTAVGIALRDTQHGTIWYRV